MTTKILQGKKADDATTNIFYFGSIQELRWKVYEVVPGLATVDPNHPVVTACSELFHKGKLAVWHLARSGLQLWLFYWASDEPDPNPVKMLKEVTSGMWEDGLPAECLAHLYKAVHQHFERSLFTAGYARVGKYFVKADGSSQQSFQIGFFIHGGHHLCASLELKETLSVHYLKKSNLETTGQKLKVVLMPVGVECTVTGLFLNLMNSPEVLTELEMLFPAYQTTNSTTFLAEIEVSGYTMLYPASHVLIVKDCPTPDKHTKVLSEVNEEVITTAISEGEVTAAACTNDTREQPCTEWKEGGYWHYTAPPDMVKCQCAHHKARSQATNPVVESCQGLNRRLRHPLNKKRLHRSRYKSYLEKNKWRDDKRPVINLPHLPIRKNTAAPASDHGHAPAPGKSGAPLPRLQPQVNREQPRVSEPFGEPHTIECVENTACTLDENSIYHSPLIPGMASFSSVYKVPGSTCRKQLPRRAFDNIPPPPVPRQPETFKRPYNLVIQSPVKKVKIEPKVEQTVIAELSPNNMRQMSVESDNERESRQQQQQRVFTHEVDIQIKAEDLDNIFDDEDEDFMSADVCMPMDQNNTVVHESCLTPDTINDPKEMLSPCTNAPSITPQDHQEMYPTPPSNDANSYSEDIILTEEHDPQSELGKNIDLPYQLLNEAPAYAPIPFLNKYNSNIPTYTPQRGDKKSEKHILINSPRKIADLSVRYGNKNSEVDQYISKELKDLAGLLGAPDFARTFHVSSVIKDETTLHSIGQKLLASKDGMFTFQTAFSNQSCKKELSDLPKLKGGYFLLKFGDCHINKFSVNSDDPSIPGGYANISNIDRLVTLDVPRMEIYVRNDHRSTVGYMPKSSVSVSLYQQLVKCPPVQQTNCFTSVAKNKFSPSLLSIMQQLACQVPPAYKDIAPEHVSSSKSISEIGKLLKSALHSTQPNHTVSHSLLSWQQFSYLSTQGTKTPDSPTKTHNTALPHPAVLVGHESQWMSVWPKGIPMWVNKGMEPYAGPSNVSYIVVTPDNATLIANINTFFKELSTVYELCQLGHHKPLQTKLRDGIMRVGKKTAKNVAENGCEDWFTSSSDPEASTWQVYSKTCQHVLAKYLRQHHGTLGESAGAKQDHETIVIYFIDPFKTPCLYTKAQLIMRCYNSMLEDLNKIPHTKFIMQCVPVEHLINTANITHNLRSLCFSVYKQTLRKVAPKPLATCLTGFGPISDEALLLESGETKKIVENPHNFTISTPYVLAPKHRAEITQPYETLFCAYSLSHDNNWIVAAVTDNNGHLLDTSVIAIDDKIRPGELSPSSVAQVWQFCLSVIEMYTASWHIVITKMGTITDLEDQVWTQNIKTASTWNTQLQEKCRTCSLRNKEKPFGIVSVAILSLQSISHISIQPISDNTKHGLSHSHILSLPSHQPVRECVERSNAKHDDTFTFYAGPEPRGDKRRRILSSAYLTSTAPARRVPKQMGQSCPSLLLGNLHQQHVWPQNTSKQNHILCSENYSAILRLILQRFDALSWLQVSPITHERVSCLPIHMNAINNIYTMLETISNPPAPT